MNLRAARLNKGLSSRAAAEEMGVTQSILLRAESGEGVRPVHAKRIADYYGCQVTDIWPIEDESVEQVA